MRLGISTHDHAELDRALAASPDYVALGPIYATTTRKPMPWAPQGLPRIAEWKRLIGGRPLVAIGGITLERAAGCFDAGADSIATIGDVTGHADPLARAAAWLTATAAHP
jgi:thiamine-phosphate pyrophosphorylase